MRTGAAHHIQRWSAIETDNLVECVARYNMSSERITVLGQVSDKDFGMERCLGFRCYVCRYMGKKPGEA